METIKKIYPVILCALLLCLPSTAAANSLSPVELARQLQDTYSKTITFQAQFKQVTTTKLSRRKRGGEGTLVISKPGLMRWDYQVPDRQVLICDGENVKMYFAKSEQLMIMSAKDYLQSDVTYDFFAGKGDILRDFDVSSASDDFCCGEPPDLTLTPKKQHPQVETIYLWLTDDHLIRKMQINDHFGSVTELIFSEIKLNEKVDTSRFQFEPPEGTEIIEQPVPEDKGDGN